jgi:hypothetical protein
MKTYNIKKKKSKTNPFKALKYTTLQKNSIVKNIFNQLLKKK